MSILANEPILSISSSLRRPKLGFLGLGWIGRNRMSAVVQAGLAEVTALADADQKTLDQAAEVAPGAAQAGSLAELLEMDLDGIVIATPSSLHAEQAIAALENGVAVFCQKPLGRDAEEVQAIVDTAQAYDRLLGVDLSYRQLRSLQEVRRLIRQGELGSIFAAELVFHNAYGPDKSWFYDPRLSGGGCVIDLGVHLVDALLWCLGSHVVDVKSSVFAQGTPAHAGQVEDYATAQLRLANETVATVSCSWRLHAGQPALIEFIFYGTKGSAVVRNVDGSFYDFQAEHLTGTEKQILVGPPDDWQGRAINEWVRKLEKNPLFDSAIINQVAVAHVLDQILAPAHRPEILS